MKKLAVKIENDINKLEVRYGYRRYKKELEQRFAEPLDEFYKRRIIFWNDEDGDFKEEVANLKLSNAKF